MTYAALGGEDVADDELKELINDLQDFQDCYKVDLTHKIKELNDYISKDPEDKVSNYDR